MNHQDRYLRNYAPVTETFAFVEAPFSVCKSLRIQMLEPVNLDLGWELIVHDQSGSLDAKMQSLLPLTTVVPTKGMLTGTRSSWCAYFENTIPASDSHRRAFRLAEQLKAKSVTAILSKDDPESQVGSVQFYWRGFTGAEVAKRWVSAHRES